MRHVQREKIEMRRAARAEMEQQDSTQKLFNPAWHPPNIRLSKAAKKARKGKKKQLAFCKNAQYLNANFRSALQEHLQANGGTGRMKFESSVKKDPLVKNQMIYITYCKVTGLKDKRELVGTGHGLKKKISYQFAALDVIIQLGLVTMEKHMKLHPPVIADFEEFEEEEDEDEKKEEVLA